MKKKKLIEVFDYDFVTTSGKTIFDILSDAESYPEVALFINANTKDNLNLDYFIGFSADKTIAPLLDKILQQDDDNENLSTKLAKIIYQRFGVKWQKLYNALNTEYNPLENYSMIETRTPDLTHDETINVKTNVTTSRTTNETNSVNGFNADDPTPANASDGSEDVTTSGDADDNETHSVKTETGTEDLTRSGNIGVTTSQQMLESEFEVRKHDFYKLIYKDIDSIICLSIY